jgi:hypothetical protein
MKLAYKFTDFHYIRLYYATYHKVKIEVSSIAVFVYTFFSMADI